MDHKFMSFDLEIAKELPEGAADWKAHRPLGITCAALAYGGGIEVYHSPDTGAAPQVVAQSVVRRLMRARADGYTVVTWNGLQFDFDILAEESGMFNECCELALNHLDLMFLFFCHKGYFLGLDAAAKGAGLPGKPEGIDGAKAPELWAAGEFGTVLDYLRNDVILTLEMARAVKDHGGIAWTSRSGRDQTCVIPELLSVADAYQIPEPDTSWMTDPYSRASFVAWMEAGPLPVPEWGRP